ncbi:uncharacterized protein HMPREF1541_07368 [Cyphellophora europaea CBS 101466]|uniref:N-acetyltransferase domain-containing protein n=1 Tax=Cyphellophora europaea (strain CBS 101466) TaxID=1220924 RepID=W2RN31_CYPE1|nr:uncharacterized protein HMPREF1541_07368 [Cyphellophora europaea CBS 101466]ETN37745.1 hypothetical protein HMPREF1541_07368 [Cyphellophora europaea CBS 101466]
MPVKVEYASDEDAPRSFEIEHLAYTESEDPVEPLLFPGPMPPDASEKRAAIILKHKREDASIVWLKAVDTETGQMIGFAQWHIYEPGKPIPEPPPREFGPGSNPEVCEAFFGSIDAKRQQVMGDKPHIFLKFLHTDPKHQRRGAGSMLIKWGIQRSEELNLPAYLEATSAGHGLYAKHGFQDIGRLDFDLAKWGGSGTTGVVLMLRPVPA